MEITYGITYGNYVSFWFVIVTYFFFRHNFVIYLFDVVTFFDDVRIALYFGTLKLRMEMTWKLCFVFVRLCNVFLFRSQLHYLFVRCSYVFLMALELRHILVKLNYVRKLRYNYVLFLFVIVTYFLLRHNYNICFLDEVMFFDDLRITSYFGTFELRTEITL